MENKEKSCYAQKIRQLLADNDIPEQYHALIQAIILILAEHPVDSLKGACRMYAEQNGTSGKIIYQTIRRAVNRSWEESSQPASPLYTRRMSPEEFVQFAVDLLHKAE